MTTINQALIDFAQFFEMRGDQMLCRSCGRACVASRADEEFRHASNCPNAGLDWRPWKMLAAIIDDGEVRP